MSKLFEKIVNNLDILLGVSAWIVSAGGFASLYFMSSVYHCQALYIYIPIWFILVVLTVIFRRRPLTSIGLVFFSVLPWLFLLVLLYFIAPAMRMG